VQPVSVTYSAVSSVGSGPVQADRRVVMVERPVLPDLGQAILRR
jgi:hypothetical protein